MEKEIYGIDKEHAHERAIELVPEDFFWNCADDLAPFGSDEGDMALAEFRRWRKAFPDASTHECLKWTIEAVGEMPVDDYNDKLLSKDVIHSQMEDGDFDAHQYITTLDISVIATGFAQLVDEGKIDNESKPLIQIAITRQKIWAELQENWGYKEEYINRMNILERVLKEA